MVSSPLQVQVVLLAAGRGTRYGSAAPKQFEILHGRPLLAYSLERLASLQPSGMVLVLPTSGLTSEVSGVLKDARDRFPDVPIHTIEGGLRRQDSVARGLRSLDSSADVILVHDAARPFPPLEPMKELILKAHEIGGGLLALPVVDTVKQEGPPGRVARTLDRSGLWLAQTPQAFRGQFIRSVEHLLDGETVYTDEAAALEHLDVPVALVLGDVMNLKITHPEDLRRAATLLHLDSPQPESGAH